MSLSKSIVAGDGGKKCSIKTEDMVGGNNGNSANVTVSNKPSNNLVVRINQDSDENLQALFDSVLNPNESRRPLQVPFRLRNLPDSFFNPPTTSPKSPSVSHSRANSADSAYDGGSQPSINNPVQTSSPSTVAAVAAATSLSDLQTASIVVNSGSGNSNTNSVVAAIASNAIAQTVNVLPPPSTQPPTQHQLPPPPEAARLQICHSRAHSSPASLQQTYGLHGANLNENATSAFIQQQQQQQAAEAVVCTGAAIVGTVANGGSSGNAFVSDIVGFPNAPGAGSVLSSGNGNILGLVNANAAAAVVAAAAGSVGVTAGGSVSGATANATANVPVGLQTYHMKQRSYDVISPIQLQNELGPLPPGWEQAKTNDGQIYYLK